jgi:hypothetical protein
MMNLVATKAGAKRDLLSIKLVSKTEASLLKIKVRLKEHQKCDQPHSDGLYDFGSV